MKCECGHPKGFHDDGFDDCSAPDCTCTEFRREGSRVLLSTGLLAVPAQVTVAPVEADADDVAPAPVGVDALIAKGKRSDVKSIRALAERAEAAVAKLGARLDEDEAAAQIRAEVADLEARLAAAKAKLRGDAAPDAPVTAPRGPLRPCGEPECEREFDTGQGLSLHRRRAHGDAAVAS